jgi:hypothetical protein
MKIRSSLMLLTCLGLLVSSSYAQESNVQELSAKALAAQSRDLRRTAHRYHITLDQLTRARAALKDATDLAMRQDLPGSTDYSTIARLWVQLDRKNAPGAVASMVGDLSGRAETAADLASYRRIVSQAQQLLYTLFDLDMERAKQIADLWPPPQAKLGDEGQKALDQFKADVASRLVMMNPTVLSDDMFAQVLQFQKSSSVPLTYLISMTQSLVSSNQKDKARTLLDQAISNLGQTAIDPGKNGDYDDFLRMLVSMYPEKAIAAYNAYKDALLRQNPSGGKGQIYEVGDQRVTISQSESTAINMLRGIYGRPELAAKFLDSNPELRAKLDQLGGPDNVLNPSPMSTIPPPRTFPAGVPPPPSPDVRAGSTVQAPEKPVNVSDLYRTLRGKADFNPDMVRHKLEDTFRKKENFQSLIQLAQMANYSDPELSSIAVEVAHGLLPLIDSLQERASSLRTLVTILRQCDGEVDPTLLKEGFILASQLREEEKQREQGSALNPGMIGSALGSTPRSGAIVIHPSDDLEIAMIAQSALDDFSSAIRSANSIADEGVRIKALLQIIQTLMNSY